MKKQLLANLAVYVLLILFSPAYSQEKNATLNKITDFPSRFFDQLQKTAAELEEQLIERSSKTLKKLTRQEARLKKKLTKKDSLVAEQVFGNVEEKYQQMKARLENPAQCHA